jgi:small nuclear ribonucleoprotein
MSEGTYKRNDHKIHEKSLGKIVLVRLKGEKKLWGKLKGFDQHLNLVLEETEDITNAKKGRKLDPKPIISIPNLYLYQQYALKGGGVARIRLRTKSLYASTSAVLAKFQR